MANFWSSAFLVPPARRHSFPNGLETGYTLTILAEGAVYRILLQVFHDYLRGVKKSQLAIVERPGTFLFEHRREMFIIKIKSGFNFGIDAIKLANQPLCQGLAEFMNQGDQLIFVLRIAT